MAMPKTNANPGPMPSWGTMLLATGAAQNGANDGPILSMPMAQPTLSGFHFEVVADIEDE